MANDPDRPSLDRYQTAVVVAAERLRDSIGAALEEGRSSAEMLAWIRRVLQDEETLCGVVDALRLYREQTVRRETDDPSSLIV